MTFSIFLRISQLGCRYFQIHFRFDLARATSEMYYIEVKINQTRYHLKDNSRFYSTYLSYFDRQ